MVMRGILLAVLLLVPGSVCSCQIKSIISVCPFPVVVEQNQPIKFTVTCKRGNAFGTIRRISIHRCSSNEYAVLAFMFSGGAAYSGDDVVTPAFKSRTTLSDNLTPRWWMSVAFEPALFQDLSYVYQCENLFDTSVEVQRQNASISVVPHPGRHMVMDINPMKTTYLPSDRVSLRCRAVSAFNSSRPEDQARMHFQYQQQGPGSWRGVPGTVSPQDQTTDGYFTSTTYVLALTLPMATGCLQRFRCYASHGQTVFTSEAAHREIRMTPGAGSCPIISQTPDIIINQNPGIDTGQNPDSDYDLNPDSDYDQKPDSPETPEGGGGGRSNKRTSSNTGLWIGLAVVAVLLVLVILAAAIKYAFSSRKSDSDRRRRNVRAASNRQVVRIVVDPPTYNSAPESSIAFSDMSSGVQSESSYHRRWDGDLHSRGEEVDYSDQRRFDEPSSQRGESYVF